MTHLFELIDGELMVASREDASPVDDWGFAPGFERVVSEEDYSRPANGTFFDENIDLADPGGALLAREVILLIDTAKPRKRKRRAADEANSIARVRALLANGLRCAWHREFRRVSFFGGAEGYGDKIHRPAWLRGDALADTVRAMAKCGLVIAASGFEGIASSYALTDTALSLAEGFGTTATSLRRTVPRERLVRAFTPKPKSVYRSGGRQKRKGDEIAFVPTAQTVAWTDALEAYNAFISEQRIEVPLSNDLEAQWIESLNQKDKLNGSRCTRPELLRTNVYRVFNDDTAASPTFALGGRLAGAWWMNMPSELRPLIRINEQPTIELDYSACFPRMLYHECGLEGPADPYDLPDVFAFAVDNGLKAENARDCVKWLFQVIINGGKRPDLATRPTDFVIPTRFPVRKMADFICKHHAPIAWAFKSGVGMRLMRDESDIALAILSEATACQWPVLAIHDSFIATADNKTRLRQLIERKYEELKGLKPIIH